MQTEGCVLAQPTRLCIVSNKDMLCWQLHCATQGGFREQGLCLLGVCVFFLEGQVAGDAIFCLHKYDLNQHLFLLLLF